jgi:hypothetical protein
MLRLARSARLCTCLAALSIVAFPLRSVGPVFSIDGCAFYWITQDCICPIDLPHSAFSGRALVNVRMILPRQSSVSLHDLLSGGKVANFKNEIWILLHLVLQGFELEVSQDDQEAQWPDGND